MKQRIATALLLFLSASAPPVSAEKLLIEVLAEEPPNSPEGIPRPTRGMSMEQVEARFGAPQKRYPSVGQPPITRWKYPRYTVYFERQYVIDTVIDRDMPTIGQHRDE